jgi:formamidopyrimidine-DNA glycosylase
VPELPEVETVRAGLAPALTGARVLGIQVFDQRSLKRHLAGPRDFVQTLTGAKILAVVRRGKFLWMPLELDPAVHASAGEKQLALVGHLGMSGQMFLRKKSDPEDKLTRVIITVETARGKEVEFRFIDQRIFGSLALDELVPTEDGKPGGFTQNSAVGKWWQNLIPASAAHIARDPLDESFDAEKVRAKFSKKHSGIKRVLLDQQVLSGVGNIYADEALWATKLHYDQPADSLSRATFDQLLVEVRRILAAAVAEGGTSFDEQYKNVNGESGYFEVSLNAYGMTNRPCNRCGREIRREAWMNRGSHFCPNCQKLRKKA